MAQITKKEIEELMKIPGNVRGQAFSTDFKYIEEIKGEKGASLLKQRMKELGNLIDYENIQTTKWYPLGLRAISLLVIKETFGFSDDDIKKMGETAPKLSFIAKTLLKTFVSVERSFKEINNYWKKHYSVGDLVPFQIDMKKKHTFFFLKDFNIHPILCSYLEGYFYTIAKFIVKSDKMTLVETKCFFKGDSYHEFSASWE